MKNPSATHQNVENTLRSIIVSLIDAQKGFQRLGENLKDEMFKKYFLWESLKRAAFRGQLEAVLHQEGMRDIVEGGTLGGAISRMWASLQAKLHEGDLALLITAEQAEIDTVQSYRDALDKELPLPVRQLLSSQAAFIEGSLDYIRSARNGSK